MSVEELRMPATDPLVNLRRTLAWLDVAGPKIWFKVAALLVREVRGDPVLSAAFPPAVKGRALDEHSQLPDELREWATWAFHTLELYTDPRHSPRPQNMPDRLRKGTTHKWVDYEHGFAHDVYIRPIVAWLEAQVGGMNAFHAGVERWIQRLRWFGPREPSADEEFYQDDLGRFLFDSGVAIEDIGREAHSARGRADFYLRDGLHITVELKHWRGSTDDKRLEPSKAPAQAARYGRDYRLARVYLVVVDTSDTERLELPERAKTHDGVELFIRTAEVLPPTPRNDVRTTVTKSTDDLGLLAP